MKLLCSGTSFVTMTLSNKDDDRQTDSQTSAVVALLNNATTRVFVTRYRQGRRLSARHHFCMCVCACARVCVGVCERVCERVCVSVCIWWVDGPQISQQQTRTELLLSCVTMHRFREFSHSVTLFVISCVSCICVLYTWPTLLYLLHSTAATLSLPLLVVNRHVISRLLLPSPHLPAIFLPFILIVQRFTSTMRTAGTRRWRQVALGISGWRRLRDKTNKKN